jgi:hypothetical protein
MSSLQAELPSETAIEPFIPWDKSLLMRFGLLDLMHGREQIGNFLGEQEVIGDDLTAVEMTSEAWAEEGPVFALESGTWYRFLRFQQWQEGREREIVTTGTLQQRRVCNDPGIISWPQASLLRLDQGTSQWASAAALTGDPERIARPPFKLALTYEAIDHWRERVQSQQDWLPRRDDTIARQALAYQALLGSETRPVFEPLQAEDYCFAVTFDYLTPEEGRQHWPGLRGHEGNRTLEMPRTIEQAKAGRTITSRDHRVIQAIAMWGKLAHHELEFAHPEAVNKSWPQFWDFIENTQVGKCYT